MKEYDHSELKQMLPSSYNGYDIAFQYSPANEYNNGIDGINIQTLSVHTKLVSVDDMIDDSKLVLDIFHSFIDVIVKRGNKYGIIFLYKIVIRDEQPIDNKDNILLYQSVIKCRVLCHLDMSK